MKAKKQPYIDYGTAAHLIQIHDFINRANRMRQAMLRRLDFLDRDLQIAQNKINDMKQMFSPVENPDAGVGDFGNDIDALRTYAWELGMSHTLFDKLKDQQFRNRFTGLNKANPVQKDEIKDIYPEN